MPNAREVLTKERSSAVLYIASLPWLEPNALYRFEIRTAPRDGGFAVTFEPGGMYREAPRGGIELRSLEAGQEEDGGRVARGRSRSANDDEEIDSLLVRRAMSTLCSAKE